MQLMQWGGMGYCSLYVHTEIHTWPAPPPALLLTTNEHNLYVEPILHLLLILSLPPSSQETSRKGERASTKVPKHSI